MSQENVDAFKRGLHAYNRRHIDALLGELDPDVEWHPALAVVLGGEQTVFHGHRGVRDSIREEDEALAEYQVEISEIRDLGNRVFAIGRARVRRKGSGAQIESPFSILTDSKGTKGRATRDLPQDIPRCQRSPRSRRAARGGPLKVAMLRPA
jgi:ketosteroid isomerase-like protein